MGSSVEESNGSSISQWSVVIEVVVIEVVVIEVVVVVVCLVVGSSVRAK